MNIVRRITEEELEHIMRSAIYLSITKGNGRRAVTYVGSGVAVSPKKALTAFHGLFKVGDQVEICTRSGITMAGTIGFDRFSSQSVDITVIDLTGDIEFESYVPCSEVPVKNGQRLVIVSLGVTTTGEYEKATDFSRVRLIERDTALFQATYY